MKEILKVHVVLDQFLQVNGKRAQALMILFHGTFTGACGEGIVLPGGVDTQVERNGEPRTMSARYVLQGTDPEGNPYHLFIENNGVCLPDAPMVTTPVIYTDREELQWIEDAELTGTVEPAGENQVLITISSVEN